MNIYASEEELQNNSVIVHTDTHGELIDSYECVPPNTMICFLAPINYITFLYFNSNQKKLYKDFCYEINNLSPEQYKTLFQDYTVSPDGGQYSVKTGAAVYGIRRRCFLWCRCQRKTCQLHWGVRYLCL